MTSLSPLRAFNTISQAGSPLRMISRNECPLLTLGHQLCGEQGWALQPHLAVGRSVPTTAKEKPIPSPPHGFAQGQVPFGDELLRIRMTQGSRRQ